MNEDIEQIIPKDGMARHWFAAGLYASGLSYIEIGRCFGITKQRVNQMLKRIGFPVMNKRGRPRIRGGRLVDQSLAKLDIRLILGRLLSKGWAYDELHELLESPLLLRQFCNILRYCGVVPGRGVVPGHRRTTRRVIQGKEYHHCADCDTWQRADRFFPHSVLPSRKQKYYSYCRRCVNRKSLDWRKRNPERYESYQLEYRRNVKRHREQEKNHGNHRDK